MVIVKVFLCLAGIIGFSAFVIVPLINWLERRETERQKKYIKEFDAKAKRMIKKLLKGDGINCHKNEYIKFRPEIERLKAELDFTVEYKPNVNVTKRYGIADMKLKESGHSHMCQFDQEKKIFEVQCSKDGENFEDIEPCAYHNSKRFCIAQGTDYPSQMKFPMTMASAVMLANMIARCNAIGLNGNTDYKYWRIGIKWEGRDFNTWFSGDINGIALFDSEWNDLGKMTKHF